MKTAQLWMQCLVAILCYIIPQIQLQDLSQKFEYHQINEKAIINNNFVIPEDLSECSWCRELQAKPRFEGECNFFFPLKQGLMIEDLEDLLVDIKVYMELEEGKNAEFWKVL